MPRENAAIVFFDEDGNRVHAVAVQIENLIRDSGCRHVLTKFSGKHLIINAKSSDMRGV